MIRFVGTYVLYEMWHPWQVPVSNFFWGIFMHLMAPLLMAGFTGASIKCHTPIAWNNIEPTIESCSEKPMTGSQCNLYSSKILTHFRTPLWYEGNRQGLVLDGNTILYEVKWGIKTSWCDSSNLRTWHCVRKSAWSATSVTACLFDEKGKKKPFGM